MTVAAARQWAHDRLQHRGPWEQPPGSNHVPDAWGPYHAIFGAPAYDAPWCGVELLLVAYHGGLKLPPNWISVLAAQQWGEDHGRWSLGSTGVRAGDAVVIGGPGVHIEWARQDAAPDGSVATHGGNWGNSVVEQTRSAGEVYGHVRLADLYPVPGRTPEPPRPKPIDRRPPEPQYVAEAPAGDLHIWQTGPRVAQLQTALGMQGVDGYFGRGTGNVLEEWAVRHNLDSHNGQLATVGLLAALEHGPAKPQLPRRMLHVGAKGGLVRRLQRGLIHHGYLEAVIGGRRQDDGDYGPHTAAAVHALKAAKRYKGDSGDVAGIRVWKVVG